MKIGVHETHPAADLFPMLADAELESLVADIRTHGLREPIVRVIATTQRAVAKVAKGAASNKKSVVTSALVLDGRNRLRACLAAKLEPRFVDHKLRDEKTAEGIGDIVGYVVSRNVLRRHLNESQRALAAARLANLEPGRPSPEKRQIGRVSQADAAKKLSVGERTVRKAAEVLEKGTEEVVQAVESGALAVDAAAELTRHPAAVQRRIARTLAADAGRGRSKGHVRALLRQESRKATAKKLGREARELPNGPFRVIVADPPWPYEWRKEDPTQRGQTPYPSMTIEEICALPVGERAHPNGAILWLWTRTRTCALRFASSRRGGSANGRCSRG